jgi:hypothetical protein
MALLFVQATLKQIAILAVCLFAACGGGTTPTPTPSTPTTPSPPANRSPVISALNIEPTFGIAYLTTFGISAQASDPDGDAVTYSWTIADTVRGQVQSFTGAEVRSAFPMSLISAVARLTVTDGRGG